MAKITTKNRKILAGATLLQDEELVKSLESLGFKKYIPSSLDSFGSFVLVCNIDTKIVKIEVGYNLRVLVLVDFRVTHDFLYQDTDSLAKELTEILDSLTF